jgi:hypothetical protein
MKRLRLPVLLALLAGCTKAAPEFVQGDIQIAPPVTGSGGRPLDEFAEVIKDGGTLEIPIRDAKGREFTIFIDHRFRTVTPGAIYLNAYPGRSNSIRVLDVRDFKQKVGDFDER